MEENINERLSKLGTKILATTRNELYIHMRFLDVALSSFAYVIDPSVNGVGTDGMCMFYHPGAPQHAGNDRTTCELTSQALTRQLSCQESPWRDSSSELLARRFFPCTPLQLVSPAACSPGMSVALLRSTRTPPMK